MMALAREGKHRERWARRKRWAERTRWTKADEIAGIKVTEAVLCRWSNVDEMCLTESCARGTREMKFKFTRHWRFNWQWSLPRFVDRFSTTAQKSKSASIKKRQPFALRLTGGSTVLRCVNADPIC